MIKKKKKSSFSLYKPSCYLNMEASSPQIVLMSTIHSNRTLFINLVGLVLLFLEFYGDLPPSPCWNHLSLAFCVHPSWHFPHLIAIICLLYLFSTKYKVFISTVLSTHYFFFNCTKGDIDSELKRLRWASLLFIHSSSLCVHTLPGMLRLWLSEGDSNFTKSLHNQLVNSKLTYKRK